MSGWAGFWIMLGLLGFGSCVEVAGKAIAHSILQRGE
jgi:hypothetical protein